MTQCHRQSQSSRTLVPKWLDDKRRYEEQGDAGHCGNKEYHPWQATAIARLIETIQESSLAAG
jgi:hypothetical protein